MSSVYYTTINSKKLGNTATLFITALFSVMKHSRGFNVVLLPSLFITCDWAGASFKLDECFYSEKTLNYRRTRAATLWRKEHPRIGVRMFDIFFRLSFVFVFCLCASDVLGYQEAFYGVLFDYCWCFAAILDFRRGCRLACCHEAWNTSCPYTASLHRRWSAAPPAYWSFTTTSTLDTTNPINSVSFCTWPTDLQTLRLHIGFWIFGCAFSIVRPGQTGCSHRAAVLWFCLRVAFLFSF